MLKNEIEINQFKKGKKKTKDNSQLMLTFETGDSSHEPETIVIKPGPGVDPAKGPGPGFHG